MIDRAPPALRRHRALHEDTTGRGSPCLESPLISFGWISLRDREPLLLSGSRGALPPIMHITSHAPRCPTPSHPHPPCGRSLVRLPARRGRLTAGSQQANQCAARPPRHRTAVPEAKGKLQSAASPHRSRVLQPAVGRGERLQRPPPARRVLRGCPFGRGGRPPGEQGDSCRQQDAQGECNERERGSAHSQAVHLPCSSVWQRVAICAMERAGGGPAQPSGSKAASCCRCPALA